MSSTAIWGRRVARRVAWTLTMAGSADPATPSRFVDVADADLVTACLAGETAAFDVIVERHRRAIYLLCYRFVGQHEDASDLAQDVFLRAYKSLGGFRGQSSLGTWLYRIGVNVCLNRVSVKRPVHEALDEHAVLESADQSPAERVLEGERAVRMRAFVSRLPAKQRAALVLRIYQDMSHQDIAGALGISVGAVKANVFHALRNLKRMIGDDVL